MNKYILFVLLLIMSGCTNDSLFEENHEISGREWQVDEIPTFRFEINDAASPYNFYWNLRNTIDYPYRNLYLTYYLEDTLGNVIDSNMHEVQLFEATTGKPLGRGITSIYSHQFLALPRYTFDSAGMYRVRLEQYMRKENLPEIVSVGVKIEKAEGS
jgi:gliding motility-associated lipoprotein GldH